jgi:hypothetical protein
MKTKDEVKESESRGVKESKSAEPRACRIPWAVGRMAAVSFSTSGLPHYSTPKFREQSENVYENKQSRS